MEHSKMVIVGLGTTAQNMALTTAIEKASVICGASAEHEINHLNNIFNKPKPLVFEFRTRLIDECYPRTNFIESKGYKTTTLDRLQQRNNAIAYKFG